MAEFRSVKIGEYERKQAVQGGAALDNTNKIEYPEQKFVKWEEVGDDTVQAQRAAKVEEFSTPETTSNEALVAGMGDSVLAAALRVIAKPDFEPDPDFNGAEALKNDLYRQITDLSDREIKALSRAKSAEEYEYISDQIDEKAARQTMAASNPVAGIAGALLGDSPLILTQVIGNASLPWQIFRGASRAVEMGATYKASKDLSQSPEFSAAVMAILGLDQAYDAIQGVKYFNKLAEKARLEKEYAAKVARDSIQAKYDVASDFMQAKRAEEEAAKKAAYDYAVFRNSHRRPVKPKVVKEVPDDPDLIPIEIPPYKKNASKKEELARKKAIAAEQARKVRVAEKQKAAEEELKVATEAKTTTKKKASETAKTAAEATAKAEVAVKKVEETTKVVKETTKKVDDAEKKVKDTTAKVEEATKKVKETSKKGKGRPKKTEEEKKEGRNAAARKRYAAKKKAAETEAKDVAKDSKLKDSIKNSEGKLAAVKEEIANLNATRAVSKEEARAARNEAKAARSEAATAKAELEQIKKEAEAAKKALEKAKKEAEAAKKARDEAKVAAKEARESANKASADKATATKKTKQIKAATTPVAKKEAKPPKVEATEVVQPKPKGRPKKVKVEEEAAPEPTTPVEKPKRKTTAKKQKTPTEATPEAKVETPPAPKAEPVAAPATKAKKTSKAKPTNDNPVTPVAAPATKAKPAPKAKKAEANPVVPEAPPAAKADKAANDKPANGNPVAPVAAPTAKAKKAPKAKDAGDSTAPDGNPVKATKPKRRPRAREYGTAPDWFGQYGSQSATPAPAKAAPKAKKAPAPKPAAPASTPAPSSKYAESQPYTPEPQVFVQGNRDVGGQGLQRLEATYQSMVTDRTVIGQDPDSPFYTRELDATGKRIETREDYNAVMDEKFDQPIIIGFAGGHSIQVSKDTFIMAAKDRIATHLEAGLMTEGRAAFLNKLIDQMDDALWCDKFFFASHNDVWMKGSWYDQVNWTEKDASKIIMASRYPSGTEVNSLRELVDGVNPNDMVHELVHAATVMSHLGGKEGHRLDLQDPSLYRRAAEIWSVARKERNSNRNSPLWRHTLDYPFESNFSNARELFACMANDPHLLPALASIDSLGKLPLHRTSPLHKYSNAMFEFAKGLLESLGLKSTVKRTLADDATELLELLIDVNKTFVDEQKKLPHGMSMAMSPSKRDGTGVVHNRPNFNIPPTKAPYLELSDGTTVERTVDGGKPKVDPEANNPVANATRLTEHVKSTFHKSFALYDNIASGSKDIADFLVSDATSTSARGASVVDLKRNFELEMNLRASKVEDAFVKNFKSQGVSWFDMFFHRKKFREVKAATEEKVTRYLQKAYDAEKAGEIPPPPPADIADVVTAYVDSGWARQWREHLINSGLMKAEDFPASDYYIGRQYSHARMHQFDKGDVIDLLEKSLKRAYGSMPDSLISRVAGSWYTRILRTGERTTGAEWRQLVQGMDENDIFHAMREVGIDDEQIREFINVNVPNTGATKQAKNLHKRANLDMFAQIELESGNFMSLADLMQTNTLGLMQSYTNRMSGRAAFAAKGITDMKELAKMLDEVAETTKPDARWFKVVDDTVNHLLGMNVGGDIPEFLRGASNIANSVMLKNSGLYQLTDMAIAMKEYGMGRVFKYMMKGGLFKAMDNTINDDTLRGRLFAVLNGAYQNEARFKFLTTHADDNLDLTNTSSIYMATHNLSQSARLMNGFSMVHRMQVNVNSGIIADGIEALLKTDKLVVKDGKLTIAGDLGVDLRVFREAGMSDELLIELRKAYAANPDKMFEPALQQQLEVVGTRVMDYCIQTIRTGETSHFAQFSPIGKMIVGYQSFALAATNKVLRRHTANDDMTGLAILAAYQLPLMLMVTKVKAELDRKELEDKDLVSQSVMNMSLIGGLSLLSPLFTDETPRHSLVPMALLTQSTSAIKNILTSDSPSLVELGKVTPLAPEFLPTRMLLGALAEMDKESK